MEASARGAPRGLERTMKFFSMTGYISKKTLGLVSMHENPWERYRFAGLGREWWRSLVKVPE